MSVTQTKAGIAAKLTLQSRRRGNASGSTVAKQQIGVYPWITTREIDEIVATIAEKAVRQVTDELARDKVVLA